MRAFVLTGPGQAVVQEVPVPVAVPGEVVVDVERAGVCGTDAEFFTGEMAYLHRGIRPTRCGWATSGVAR
jgi:threonine dehydrogenase-like Zn-dependent dehydrogenase